jgi:hypothetical protein
MGEFDMVGRFDVVNSGDINTKKLDHCAIADDYRYQKF